MATYQITKVRTVQAPGAAHEHIEKVMLADGSEWFRSTIISDIRDRGYEFYVEVGGTRARVIVASCLSCSLHEYIRTVADSTTRDNLLSLPRF